MDKELIDIELFKHHATGRAVFVSEDGDVAKAVWLPTSQIEIAPSQRARSLVIVTMPVWLATEKGLI